MRKNVKTKFKSFSLILEKIDGFPCSDIPQEIHFAGIDFYHSFFEHRKTFKFANLSGVPSYGMADDNLFRIIWYGSYKRIAYYSFYRVYR